jgi:hypothetical protein
MGNSRRVKNNKTAKNVVDQLSKPSPRMNLRGRLNENVPNITGNEYATPATVSVGNTLGYGFVLLAPGNNAGRANAAVQTVGRYFQKGVYLPGTFLKYIPSVGLNTPGNIIIGYIDSPDVIKGYLSLPPGQQLNYIRDLSNSRTGPVWQELTFPLTQPPRRKTFMVDPSISNDIDAIDQSVQAYFVWCVYGTDTVVGQDKAFGQLMIHCKNRFEEVKSFIVPQ